MVGGAVCDKTSGPWGHDPSPILFCYKVRYMVGPVFVGQAFWESLDSGLADI